MYNRINVTNSENNILYTSSIIIDENFKSSLHVHNNLEIILIIDGEGEIVTSSKIINVKKNDLLIVNPNSRHYERGQGLSFIALGIRGANIYVKDTYTKKIIVKRLDNEMFSTLKKMFEIINSEAFAKKQYSNKIIESAYSIISSYMFQQFSLNESKSDGDDSEIVSSIKTILNNYFSSDISLDDLSRRLSLSKASLCHIFKKETGKTIIEYKLDKQLEEACNLLKVTDMNVSQVTYLVGFNSDSYFIKMFKQKYNITPTSYRKMVKAK